MKDVVGDELEQVERHVLNRRPCPFEYHYGDRVKSMERAFASLLQLFLHVKSITFNTVDLVRGPKDVLEISASSSLSAEMLSSERSTADWRKGRPRHLFRALRHMVPDNPIMRIHRTHYLDLRKVDKYREEFKDPGSILRPLPDLH